LAPRSGGWPDPQQDQREVVVSAPGHGGLEQRLGARPIVLAQERLDRRPIDQIGRAAAADQIARAGAAPGAVASPSEFGQDAVDENGGGSDDPRAGTIT
jgi:hypothetical protein